MTLEDLQHAFLLRQPIGFVLGTLLEAISQIAKYAVRGRSSFDEEELIGVWIVHHLEVMGEACRGLSAEFRQAHPDNLGCGKS
jgi:uncharacterized protein with HEPN domain